LCCDDIHGPSFVYRKRLRLSLRDEKVKGLIWQVVVVGDRAVAVVAWLWSNADP